MNPANRGIKTTAILHKILPYTKAYDEESKAIITTHVLEAVSNFPGLEAHEVHGPPDGSLTQGPQGPAAPPTSAPVAGSGTSKLVALSGTVPISIQGARYNIPVSIRLPQGYPRQPPACWVTPAQGMVLNARHRLVSPIGRFLGATAAQEWMGRAGGGLVPVLAQMIVAFEEMAPVYALPPGVSPDAAAASVKRQPSTTSQVQASSQAVTKPPTEEEVAKALERVDALATQSRQLAQAEEDAERKYSEGDEALEAGKLDLAGWVKMIRAAAREEFFSRALLSKVVPAKIAAEETFATLLKARQVYEDHKKAIALAEELRQEENTRRQERIKRDDAARKEEAERQRLQEQLAREKYEEMQRQQQQPQQPQFWAHPPGMSIHGSLPFDTHLQGPHVPGPAFSDSGSYPSGPPPPFMAPPPGAFGAAEAPDMFGMAQDPFPTYAASYPYPPPPLDAAGQAAPYPVGMSYPPPAGYPPPQMPPVSPPNYYQPY